MCSDVSAPKLSQVGIVSTVCDVFMQRLTDTDIILQVKSRTLYCWLNPIYAILILLPLLLYPFGMVQCMYAMIRFLAFDSTREAFLEIFEQVNLDQTNKMVGYRYLFIHRYINKHAYR